MAFDASQLLAGLEVTKILSHEKHYSSFLCGICSRMVSLDAVVANCCHQPYCRKCFESMTLDCFVLQKPCRCPGCRVDMQNGDFALSKTMQFGSMRVSVQPLRDSQPLAYKVLCQVQVTCQYHASRSCAWKGDYENFLRHTISHRTDSDSTWESDEVETVTPTNTVVDWQRDNQSIEKQNVLERERYENSELSRAMIVNENQDEVRSTSTKPPKGRVEKATTDIVLDFARTTHSDSASICITDGDSGQDNHKTCSIDSDSPSENYIIREQNHLQQGAYEKAEKLKKQANARFNKGDLVEAQKLYTNGIAIMVTIEAKTEDYLKLLSSMYSNRAATYYKEKLFDECVTDCDFSIQYEPTLTKSWIRKRRSLAIMGACDESFSCIRQAHLAMPQDKKTLEEFKRAKSEMEVFKKIKDLMEKNRVQEACHFSQTIVDNSENVHMLVFAARVAIAAGATDKALETITKVLDLNPKYVDGLELRGVWFFSSGDIDRGIAVLTDVSIIHRDSEQIAASLARFKRTHSAYEEARSAMKRGDHKDAIERFTAAIEASDPLPTLSLLFAVLRTERARCYLLAKQYLVAMKECQEIVNVNREYAPAWVVRSQVLLALGKAEIAQRELMVARRTWGKDNTAIEEEYKRVMFELRVIQANDDIVLFQTELDQGILRKMSHSERKAKHDKSSNQRVGSMSLELKHKTKSVRNMGQAPRRTLTNLHGGSLSRIDAQDIQFSNSAEELSAYTSRLEQISKSNSPQRRTETIIGELATNGRHYTGNRAHSPDIVLGEHTLTRSPVKQQVPMSQSNEKGDRSRDNGSPNRLQPRGNSESSRNRIEKSPTKIRSSARIEDELRSQSKSPPRPPVGDRDDGIKTREFKSPYRFSFDDSDDGARNQEIKSSLQLRYSENVGGESNKRSFQDNHFRESNRHMSTGSRKSNEDSRRSNEYVKQLSEVRRPN